jgi:GNAT superfamily N-acetyltransferase
MMCTHPKHRRRGAASIMLQWGVDRADELNCEIFVEASTHGAQVYRTFGFIFVDEYWIRRGNPEPDEEWKMLEETHPFTAAWMWRPKQRVRDQEQTQDETPSTIF